MAFHASDPGFAGQLLAGLPGECRSGEPLWRHTTMGVGGPAWCFYVPPSREALREAIRRARRAGLPWKVIGRGSNLLFPDTGFPGLVIATTALKGLTVGEGTIEAEAGVSLGTLVPLGLPSLAGIPGTLGGALAMNAGTRAGTIGEAVVWVEALDRSGHALVLDRGECGFTYRDSALRRRGLVVLAAGLLPRKEGPDPRKLIAHRRSTQPLSLPSAGCVFRNPPDAPPAGWLLDKAGLKGKRVGDAMISRKHANFICNLGRAKAWEVLALMEIAWERVRRLFGVQLEPEVELVWT